jgi:hypothetical protein
MSDAVAEYARHRAATDNWALGRFVVSLSRVAEFSQDRAELAPDGTPWPVSLVASLADCSTIADLRWYTPNYVIEAAELKAGGIPEIARATALAGLQVFIEPGAAVDDLDAFAAAVAGVDAAAKIRTGGVTADAFPTPRRVLDFLRACRTARIRFKATAGLHHAIRGDYRLTYEPEPPTGLMFGFLNVAIAAALLWFGRSDDVVLEVLDERSLAAFEFTDSGVAWRDERLTNRELDEVRTSFFAGFGSCSFREPMAEIGLEAVPRA